MICIVKTPRLQSTDNVLNTMCMVGQTLEVRVEDGPTIEIDVTEFRATSKGSGVGLVVSVSQPYRLREVQ